MKDELIKAMREAMLGISKAKFAGWRKIAERESNPDAVPRIDREIIKWVEKQEPQMQACAEAALTLISREWVRVEDVQKLIDAYKKMSNEDLDGFVTVTPHSVCGELEKLLPTPPKTCKGYDVPDCPNKPMTDSDYCNDCTSHALSDHC